MTSTKYVSLYREPLSSFQQSLPSASGYQQSSLGMMKWIKQLPLLCCLVFDIYFPPLSLFPSLLTSCSWSSVSLPRLPTCPNVLNRSFSLPLLEWNWRLHISLVCFSNTTCGVRNMRAELAEHVYVDMHKIHVRLTTLVLSRRFSSLKEIAVVHCSTIIIKKSPSEMKPCTFKQE